MSVGSHGMDHVPWRRLGWSAIDREIAEAKQVLEDTLRAAVETAACPFGAYDRRTLRKLRDAGFKGVYTGDRGWARSQDWLVSRNTVCRWDSADSVKRIVSGSPHTTLAREGKRWIEQRL